LRILAVAGTGGWTGLVAADTDEPPNWRTDTLSGDWKGLRSALYERGAEIEAGYRLDLVNNASGGRDRGTRALGTLELKLSLDGEKLAGLGGASADIHLFSHLGGKPNAALVGSYMGVNNAEVQANGVSLFHAWVQQTFWGDTASVLFGLYAIDSEFYVTEASGVFLHPSLGMSAETATSGRNGPPIFPRGALGVRFRWQPSPAMYGQVAVTDGVPGSLDDPRSNRVRLGGGEGSMFITEWGYTPGESGHAERPVAVRGDAPAQADPTRNGERERLGKIAVGFFRYLPRLNDFTDVHADSGAPVRRFGSGAYFIAEGMLHSEPGSSQQGLAGFFRHGRTDAHVTPLAHSTSLGLRYIGLLPNRDDDVCGIAITRARAAEKFRRANPPMTRTETAVEFTYRARMTSWLALQPTLQRVVHPGFDPTLRNAWVASLRADVAF
jgi:porin